MVKIYINVTGVNDILPSNSEVTVTITGPSSETPEFSESYSLNNGQTESIKFVADEGDLVGEWTVLLESNNLDTGPSSPSFDYDYNWLNYYPSNV